LFVYGAETKFWRPELIMVFKTIRRKGA